MTTGVIVRSDEDGNPPKFQIVNSNAQGAVVITPNDATDIAVTKGLYLGATGDIHVTLKDGTTVTFTALSGGLIHPIAATRIWLTGTTATNILAVY